MKRAYKVIGPLLTTLLFSVSVQAGDDIDDRNGWGQQTTLTIAEIVAASGGEFDRNRRDYDILLNAVIAADLVGPLADPEADLTVFAPNDAAFIRLARDFGYRGKREDEAFQAIVGVLTELGGGDPIPVLTNILLYHVSPGSQYLYEVIFTDVVDTLLEGGTIVPNGRHLLDNDPDFRDPQLSLFASDIAAVNGKIHTINRVLIPVDVPNVDLSELPTITEIVASSGGDFDNNVKDFDILLNAVVAAGLADALNDPSDTLTVLAPNDLAFIRTARSLGYHGSSEAEAFNFIVAALTDLGDGDPIPLLQAILLYHVLGEALPVKNVVEADSLTTALGATITPETRLRRLHDNDPALPDPRVPIRTANIRASNGFIHPITRVLIPVDLSTL